MKREAVFHINTEEYIYPVARNRLIVRIRTAKKEIRQCQIIYWDRTDCAGRKILDMECAYRDGLFDYFQANLVFPRVARYQKYYFRLKETNGEIWYYSVFGIDRQEPGDNFFEYLYANQNDVISVPGWAQGTVYYQIFPERFFNGDGRNDPDSCMEWGTPPTRENYMGGDLEGIRQKIPYLRRLGIECLYLNPIFEGDFNHKYATTDYFRIDPIFGTNETFRALVEDCHGAGIRVVLDGVFNHTGIHFPPFQDLLEKQERSEYREWFLVNSYPVAVTHHSYECVGAYKWMPKLNTANRKVREFVLGVLDHWIAQYGIDGWRLDVADETDPALWQEARIYLKERYPEVILIGETWGYGGRLLRGNQMDCVMNYMFRDIARDYFGKEILTEEELDHRLNRMLALHRDQTNRLMYNLLDSHDTERFLYWCGQDRRRMMLAVAFQMLFPGSPAVYYGDEAGITGENDPDCRKCMVWSGREDELFSWYQKWIHVRKKYRCIREGSYRTILADRQGKAFGFVRACGKERIYVFFHKGEESTEIICPVLEAGEYEELEGTECFRAERADGRVGLFNEDIMDYKGVIRMKMEPCSIKVVKEKGGFEG